MVNAALDDNGRETITARLESDGSTIVRVCADPLNDNGLCVHNGTTGSDNGGNIAKIDENTRPHASGFFAYSSTGDGTLVAIYATADGKLLIDST